MSVAEKLIQLVFSSKYRIGLLFISLSLFLSVTHTQMANKMRAIKSTKRYQTNKIRSRIIDRTTTFGALVMFELVSIITIASTLGMMMIPMTKISYPLPIFRTTSIVPITTSTTNGTLPTTTRAWGMRITFLIR